MGHCCPKTVPPRPQCPDVLTFVKQYYDSLGRSRSIVTGDYYRHNDPVVTRVTCMECARCALYAIITHRDVPVELASEVGVSDDIRPDDSVSQVGRYGTPERMEAERAERMEAERA